MGKKKKKKKNMSKFDRTFKAGGRREEMILYSHFQVAEFIICSRYHWVRPMIILIALVDSFLLNDMTHPCLPPVPTDLKAPGTLTVDHQPNILGCN
jgi:hypothetical protein